VAIADREIEVRTEMPLASPIMTKARIKPALPTTYPKRKNSMMPRMVRMLGVNTPPNVPRLPVDALELLLPLTPCTNTAPFEQAKI